MICRAFFVAHAPIDNAGNFLQNTPDALMVIIMLLRIIECQLKFAIGFTSSRGLLKHEYDYFPQCMSQYFFRNPDKLLEKIREDNKLYFDFQWHYRLPSEAFSDIEQLLRWTDILINASNTDKSTIYLVGSILGKSPDGIDGIFPHGAVRRLLEIKKNERLTNAVACGKINSLGAKIVEDGKKEKEKADIYKMQAKEMEIDYPQTSVILRILADFYERGSKMDQISSEIEPLQ